MQQEEDAVMVMMPADHIIVDIPRFQQAIKAGYQMAEQGFLITFGIKPQHAETGYGYIQCGEPIKLSLEQRYFYDEGIRLVSRNKTPSA